MVHFSSHPPKKSHINVRFKIFSIIRIDNIFRGFILILNVPWGQLRTKCHCHTTFWHQSAIFLICFRGNTVVVLDIHCGSDGFILTTWTLSSCEIVKLKSMTYIPQYLSGSWNSGVLCSVSLGYYLPPAYWYHNLKQCLQYCGKIFISKKNIWNCLEFIHLPLILKFQ